MSTMILPTARLSLIPTVTIPALRTMKIASWESQDGETVSIPEGVVREINTAASVARTVRPARRGI